MNNKAVSIVFVASLLTLAACTPQDKRISDDIRPKIRQFQNGNNKGRGNTTAGNEFALENYSLAAFLGEKQIEIIEFMKLATGTAQDTKTTYRVSNSETRASGLTGVLITVDKTPINYGSWKMTAKEMSLDVEFSKTDMLESFKATTSKKLTSVDSTSTKRFYVNSFEKSYSIEASVGDTAEQLKVTMTSAGDLSGARGGANKVMPFTVKISMVLDRASLDSSTVKILSSTAAMTYPGFKEGQIFNINLVGTNSEVKAEGLCNELTGSFKSQAGPKTKFDMTFGDDQILAKENGRTQQMPLVDCGQRPTVELNRFHSRQK